MRKKRILQATGAAFALCLACSAKVPVYAGDINAAEQRIINFYNGTFSYNGKTYVATEEAKASVYAKLSEDGVDLTDQEAETAIRQASAQVGDGVEQGYLTEVSSGNSEQGEGAAGNGSESENGKDASGSENGKSEKKGSDSEDGKSDRSGSDSEKGNPDKTDANKEGGSGSSLDTGSAGEGISGQGAASAGGRDSGRAGDETGSEDESQGHAPQPFLKIDLAQLLEEAGQEEESCVKVTPGKNNIFIVEQYLRGKVTTVSQDGYILFEGGLPLKNTGYQTRGWKLAAAVMAAGFSIVLGAAIRLGRKEKAGR
ncbi:MAG: hypothetical protein HFH49_17185 [Lachnospiraceae bacterium]|nr:hypothetical protein [Lachnospiraceae bacterium]